MLQEENQKEKPKSEESKGTLIQLGPNMVCKNHYFIRRGKDAFCKTCPLGYPLGIADVKEGHIYIDNTLVA